MSEGDSCAVAPSTPRPPRRLRVGWTSRARSISCAAKTTRARPLRTAAGKAARAESASPATRLAALVLVGQVAREEDDARTGMERALVLVPGPSERALLLASLVSWRKRQHRPEAALQRWHEAAVARPDLSSGSARSGGCGARNGSLRGSLASPRRHFRLRLALSRLCS